MYIRPDDEKKLKQLALKKHNSKSRQANNKSTASVVSDVAPLVVDRPKAKATVGLHLNMMMSSED